MNYLDDIFIYGDTFAEYKDTVLATVNLLLKLGFSIHPEKPQVIPVQKIEYLGFLIEMKRKMKMKMKIPLTKAKQDGLKNLIAEVSNSSKLRIRDIPKVLGSFEAALPAITNGCLYMFYFQKLKNDSLKLSKENFDAFVKLTSTAKIELCWWDKHLTCSQDMFTESPKLTIFSHTCPTGWGACESCFRINSSEMTAALYALKIYTRDISNCHIQLKVDNTSSLAWINEKTAPNEAIFLIANEIWDYCMGKGLWVSASYINTNNNEVADKESRKLRNNLE